MAEKRRKKRMHLDVSVKLERVDKTEESDGIRSLEVEVTDISSSGIGFYSDKELEVLAFYDTRVQIWTKEIIDTIIQVVRRVPNEKGGYNYGGIFVGMLRSDAMKIDAYSLFQEEEA